MKSVNLTMIFCPRWGVQMPWTAPAYLLEAVRSRGYTAQYLDYNIRLYWDNLTPELWRDNLQHQFWNTNDLDYFLDQIDLDEIQGETVGFSVTETNIRFSVALAKRLKKHAPHKTILFGGHRVFFARGVEAEVPIDCCDAVIKGEGEVTLLDILENGLKKNAGTYTLESGKWVLNGERPLLKDLDTFPWPRYKDVTWDMFPARHLTIMGSRGCINRCAFCNDIVRAGHKFRKRSAEHIAEEMLFHKKENVIGYTIFNDPIVNAHYKNVERLCDILIENSFDRPWAANFAVRRNMPVDLMKKLKRSGFHTAVIGLESGSQKVLDLMKKPSTVDDARWFINALHDAGIKIDLNIVVGFPGESEDDFQMTMDLITELAPKISKIVSICTLNIDFSYLIDHLDEYNVKELPYVSWHINWSTKDEQNTYDIRCKRAERLILHAQKLNLTHLRFDVDITRQDRLITVDEVVRRKKAYAHVLSLSEGTRPVLLWGAGKNAEGSLADLKAKGYNVVAFVDSDPAKSESNLLELPVLSPSALKEKRRDANPPFIVIGSMYFEEISDQLREMQYEIVQDFQDLQFLLFDCLNVNNPLVDTCA